jgi:hypothetical protein
MAPLFFGAVVTKPGVSSVATTEEGSLPQPHGVVPGARSEKPKARITETALALWKTNGANKTRMPDRFENAPRPTALPQQNGKGVSSALS